jgi:DNA polymerase I-like protein with 3'-5' exonuclease and polymerase domains
MRGFRLEMEGIVALAQAEHNGLICNEKDLQKSKSIMTKRMDMLEVEIRKSKEIKKFSKKDSKGRPVKFSLTNPHHLSYLVFNDLGYETEKKTATGKNKADKEVFSTYNIDVVDNVLEWKRWNKARDTYVASFEREITDSVIHPFFHLHIVPSFRSCVAKGTKILAVRDFIKYPDGVPIEEIKMGDYVYCFNDDLKLVIKRVIWAGKTGHRKVIRVFFNKARGGKNYIDVTPEHKIRGVNGEYVRADQLLSCDFRDKSVKNWNKQPKRRVLSCSRVDDRLFATNNYEELEHRKIYSFFYNEELSKDDVIHHKNENHLDHEISNLEKTDIYKHGSIHYPTSIGTRQAKLNSIIAARKAREEGRIVPKYGFDNPHSIKMTKEECIEVLRIADWKISKTVYDFSAMKRICKYYDIDIKKLAFCYNKFGLHLTEELVFNTIKELGFSGAVKKLRINYYKLEELCKFYGIEYERSYANQNGFRKEKVITMNNHVITKIEELEEEVDVYDIEVEDEHNFIANEICVHNSSSDVNFQNIPKRDVKVANLIRRTLRCKPGHKFAEYDYSAQEVHLIACLNKDPTLIKYIEDGYDMHRDMASKIFIKDPKEISKKERYNAKNGFVFPTFYGSYYKKTAAEIWNTAEKESIQWLKSQGIKTLDDFTEHMKAIEDEFWYDRFPVAREYKETIIMEYENKGYIEMPSGFRCYGPMSRNDILNYPVQGAAFHCLLWTFTQLDRVIKKRKMETTLIGQIHDSTVVSVHPEEEEMFDHFVWLYGTQKIREHWDWLIVPLGIEKSISKVDGSWSDVEEIGLLKE